MKNTNTARESAFFTPRILTSSFFALASVFLALLAAANPSRGGRPGFGPARGANPRVSLTGMPTPGGHILFNQMVPANAGVGVGMPAQRFQPSGPNDAEGADDFLVSDPQGWTIGQFNFGMPEFGLERNPGTVNIRVYPDASGEPGAPAVCSYDGLTANMHGTQQLRVPLPTPCVLGPGVYWLSLQRIGGQWPLRWALGSPNPNPAPFVLGAHGRWRNPGNGFQSGCTDWSDANTCLQNGQSISGGNGAQYHFQVCGAVGNNPSQAVGCGDDNAELNLAITLAVDNGEPTQCGTAPTLTVDAGTLVNVCYTVTNTGNATLGFHWLRDNLNIEVLSRTASVGGGYLPPGQTLQFNRLTKATKSQTIAAESQATDVLPWYFTYVQNFAFVDIAGTGTALNLDDDGSANVTMPFRFNLFGVSSDQLCVNNNGFLLFDWSKPCDGFHENSGTPNENIPLGSSQISPFWDDLFTGGNVYYGVVGTAPNRRFIVQWNQKNHYDNGVSDSGGVTFQVILDEATNDISYEYLDTTFDNPQHPEWDRGNSATVGFQSYPRQVGFGGPWRIYSQGEIVINPQSGLTWGSMGLFHATANASTTLNVRAPSIAVTPDALQAAVKPGNSTSVPLTIANTGELDLMWQTGEGSVGQSMKTSRAESSLAKGSHFPSAPVPTIANQKTSQALNGSLDSWGRAPRQKPVRVNRASAPAPILFNAFATRAFASRQRGTPPFGPRYDRLNDLANPGDTEELASLHGRDIWAAEFIGNDFSRQFAIDDCCKNFFAIDTATGETSINMGTVHGSPQVVLWLGLAWDSSTNTLYAVGANDFSAQPTTRFFLARIDIGHDVRATTIGELPGLTGGVAIVEIAVDRSGKMFGVDIQGNRLFAINKQTAQATPVGLLGLGFDATGSNGLDFDDATDTLYLASLDGISGIASLYTVDTSTGLALLVGRLGDGSQHTAFAIAAGAPCVPPSDVPWLSVSPTEGTTAPGNSAEVTVLLDASALGIGTYQANVCVGSNDPSHRLVPVPVTLTVTPTLPLPTSAASRKVHGAAGPFDMNLPLTGNAAIECRSGGATNDYQIRISFAHAVTVNGSPQADVTTGTGDVGTGGSPNGGVVSVNGAVVTVPLTNIVNAQTIVITLFNVSDGTNTANVTIPMRVLLGDTNGDGAVNSADISQTKSQSGHSLTNSNFREDLTTDGNLNSADIGLVKSKSGTGLP